MLTYKFVSVVFMIMGTIHLMQQHLQMREKINKWSKKKRLREITDSIVIFCFFMIYFGLGMVIGSRF